MNRVVGVAFGLGGLVGVAFGIGVLIGANFVRDAGTSAAVTSSSVVTENADEAGPTQPVANATGGCEPVEGENLLRNPSFEFGTTIATEWTDESTTVGMPTYSLDEDAGVVEGTRSLRVRYTGQPDDDGTKKAQFFQAPIGGVEPGQIVRFSICVSAGGAPEESMKNAYAILGVESFQPDRTYISDVSTNITLVSSTPTRFSTDYTVPEGAGYIAVFVQSPEFSPFGVIDICYDDASLVVI